MSSCNRLFGNAGLQRDSDNQGEVIRPDARPGSGFNNANVIGYQRMINRDHRERHESWPGRQDAETSARIPQPGAVLKFPVGLSPHGRIEIAGQNHRSRRLPGDFRDAMQLFVAGLIVKSAKRDHRVRADQGQ